MRKSRKVIVSCAVTGSIHTPTMTPHLPITPDHIASEATAAAEAGAAILHLHARNPKDGSPSQEPEHFKLFLPRIKQSCDAVVNITTGGGLGMTLDQRLAAAMWAKPEVASMNMGSLNFNISGAAARIKDFREEWERPYLERTKDFILSNTFTQIERGITELSANGTRFEFECYDIGHLYNLAHFVDRGMVKAPFFVQGVFQDSLQGSFQEFAEGFIGPGGRISVIPAQFIDELRFDPPAKARPPVAGVSRNGPLGG